MASKIIDNAAVYQGETQRNENTPPIVPSEFLLYNSIVVNCPCQSIKLFPDYASVVPGA
jgi:hypothetical protein